MLARLSENCSPPDITEIEQDHIPVGFRIICQHAIDFKGHPPLRKPSFQCRPGIARTREEIEEIAALGFFPFLIHPSVGTHSQQCCARSNRL
ncbi:MAG: hypothetical protein R3D68_07780 [Hyphomicrobiaceae bacterium]